MHKQWIKSVVADSNNHRLRLIHTATNEVTTIAGDGKEQHSDGKALDASILCPQFLVFDGTTSSPESVLYISCSGLKGLRRFDLMSGTSFASPNLSFFLVCCVSFDFDVKNFIDELSTIQ